MILGALSSRRERSVAEIAEQIECDARLHGEVDRDLSDGYIYVALQRMGQRGLIEMRRAAARSVDGRHRQIGFYRISGAGEAALSQYLEQASRVRRVTAAVQGV